MPKPRERWGLDPVIEDLLDVARPTRGIRDEALLATRTALLAHPPVHHRIVRGMSPRQALEDLLDNLQAFGGRSGLLKSELEAVAVLLGVNDLVVVEGRTMQPRNYGERVAVAKRILGIYSADWAKGVHPGRDKTLPKRSGESDLYERLVDALRHVEVPVSTTSEVAATPPTCRAVVDWTHLTGTWAGVTESEWLIKDRGADVVGQAPCFMVIEQQGDEPALRWYYRHGLSVSISTRLVELEPGRSRLIAVYEAFVDPSAPGAAPSHRGSCLLDVSAGGVIGPYFNDRRTHGILRFDRRIAERTASFEAATELFDAHPLS